MSCAVSQKAPCCCDGCCRDIIVPSDIAANPPVIGTIFKAEIIETTAPCCLTAGATVMLTDVDGSSIWTTNGVGLQECGNIKFWGLALVCGSEPGQPRRLMLSWDKNHSIGNCPLDGLLVWVFESGQCKPFEFIFRYDFVDHPFTGCICAVSGFVRVKITIES